MTFHQVKQDSRFLFSIGLNSLLIYLGLDAAGPLWCYIIQNDKDKRLDPSDAAYVQAIHTTYHTLVSCSGTYGHQDFYPNEGIAAQPGCKDMGTDLSTVTFCSHHKAIDYFIQTLNPAADYEGCSKLLWKMNLCNSENGARLGIHNKELAPGSYYVSISA